MMNFYNVILTGITFLFFILYPTLLKKKKVNTLEVYSVDDRQYSWFRIALGLSTTFVGGASLISLSGLGYEYGWTTLIDPIAVFLATCIVALCINLYIKKKVITVGDLLQKKSKHLKFSLGLVSFFMYVLMASAQIVAASKILQNIFFIRFEFLAILVALGIGMYIIRSGYFAVTKTDIIQFFFMVTFFLIPLLYCIVFNIFSFEKFSVEISDSIGFSNMSLNLMILLGYAVVFVPLSQDINIRIQSAKDKLNARIGVFLGGFLYFLFLISAIYIGVFLKLKGFVLVDPEKSVNVFFEGLLGGLSIFPILAIFSAIISTADSFLFSSIVSLTNDVTGNYFLKNKARNNLIISGVFTLILCLLIALFFQKVLSLIIMALFLYISIYFPVTLGKYLKIDDKVLTFTVVISIIVIILFEIFSLRIPLKSIFYPIFHIAMVLLYFAYMSVNKKILK